MPPSDQPRVFISYARKDGTTLAQRLQSDLTKQGFDAWLDTERIEGGASWSNEIDKQSIVPILFWRCSVPGPSSPTFAGESKYGR